MIKKEFIEVINELLETSTDIKLKELKEETVALLVIASELKQIREILQEQNEQFDRLNDSLDNITIMSPKGNSFLNVVASIYEN